MASKSEYSKQLVEKVRQSGIYLIQHADDLIDNADLKRCVEIHIIYEQGEIPEIKITQAHYMPEVIPD